MKQATHKHAIVSHLLTQQAKITLIGAGGNGCQMLSGLARLDRALRGLGHPGLNVTLYDPDTVSESNIGRQLFYPNDIGHYKAVVLMHRVNCTYGLSWEAQAVKFGRNHADGYNTDILITCVDSAAARRGIWEHLSHASTYFPATYWLDIGNRARIGQIFLTQVPRPPKLLRKDALPTLADVLPEIIDESIPEDDAPSCSLAEALAKQDLFINQHVVTWGLQLLWDLFRRGGIDIHGYWINLESGRVNPVPVPEPIESKGGTNG